MASSGVGECRHLSALSPGFRPVLTRGQVRVDTPKNKSKIYSGGDTGLPLMAIRM